MSSKVSWFLICIFSSLIGWVSISKFSLLTSSEVEDPTLLKKPIKSNEQTLTEESINQTVRVVPTKASEMRDYDTQKIPLGIDPFKEFLEKQEQNSKDQVVSPFGKN
jgi:hypothetical protein